MSRPSSPPNPNILWALAASVVTFVAFLPALSGGFVNWDDDLNFLANPAYRGLGVEQIRWMLTTFHMGPYQPLAWLTLGFDYTLWKMDARGYHFTSVLIHALNAGLYFAVARLLLARALAPAAAAPAGGATSGATSAGAASGRPGTPRPRGAAPADAAAGRSALLLSAAAWLAALLFAVHPLRVESVAWLTERRDVVSGFFFLLTLLAYLVVDDRRRRGQAPGGWRTLPPVAFALSLLGKATGVTGPFVLGILDVYPLRRLPGDPHRWASPPARQALIEKLPYLLMAAVIGVVAILGQKSVGALRSTATLGLLDRVGLTIHALAFYLRKTLLPVGLSPLYERQPDFSIAHPSVLIAGAVLLALTLLLVAVRRRYPAGLAAWLAFVLMALPVSGIAAAGHQLAADRYSYFACLPFPLLAAGALLTLATHRPALRAALAGGALVLVAGLALLTARQSATWHDSVTLWTHAAAVDPASDKAALNLASALVERQDLRGAEKIYRERLVLHPDLADANYSLGMVLLMAGRQAESEAQFRATLDRQPGLAMAQYGLGIALMERGAYPEARAALEKSLTLKPEPPRAREALAEIDRVTGR